MTTGGHEDHLRTGARRSLRRAKLVVALGLVLVLMLALAGVGLGWKATQEQKLADDQRQRAVQAEMRAESELQHTYLAEARGQRLGNTLARRGTTLEIVRRAAALQPSTDLRDEAVAALALPGLEPESSIPVAPDTRTLNFLPDLHACLESRGDGSVAVLQAADRREIKTLRRADAGLPDEQGAAIATDTSMDGRLLTVRYEGGALVVWDAAAGRALLVHDGDRRRHSLSTMRFSSDARFIAGPVFTPVEGQAVIEVATGEVTASFPDIESWRHVAVRPGSTMFAVNTEPEIAVVDWKTGQRVAGFDFPAGCRSLNWSADGAQLAIAGNLLEVHVWDFAARTRKVLPGHRGDVFHVRFNPGGGSLVSSATDGVTRLWDLTQQQLLGLMPGRLILMGSGQRVAMETPGKRMEVRRITPSPVWRRSRATSALTTGLRALDVSADGHWAAGIVRGESLLLWNLNAESPPQQAPYPGIQTVSFDPATARLFTGGTGGLNVHAWRAEASRIVLEPAQEEPLWHGEPVNHLVLSKDGRRSARVNYAGGRVWLSASSPAAEPRSIRGLNSTASAPCSPWGTGTVSLSPDGKWLVCGWGGNSGVTVYKAESGEPAAKLFSGEGNVQFSPDGRWLVLSRSRHCQVYRAGSWDLLWDQKDLPVSAAATAAFSPDGSMLAAPDSATSVALWETVTGRRLASLEAPDATPVTTLRWTGDGSRLVCGTRRQEVEVWEVPVLARELNMLGLGWDQPIPAPPAPAAVSSRNYPFHWLAAGVLIAGTGAAALAVVALRRHRRLIEDIARGEALGAARERELQSAREISDLKSSFVSMVSHEFRTPLAVILSSTDILANHLDRLSPERRAQQIAGIRGSTQQMARLIEEVLLLGKVEAGKMTFAPQAVNLHRFCSELVDEALSANARRCPITLRCAEDLPESVHADPALLHHILSNLLSNASKYSPEGAEVSLYVEKSGAGLVFRVVDKGIGIPPEDQARIFEPFHRAKNVGQTSGTGLGLMITKRCVELHGGSIALQSVLGEGTTVEVLLPPVTQFPAPGPQLS